MVKIIYVFFILILSLRPFSIVAQSSPAVATEQLQTEQRNFLEFINNMSIDSNIVYRLSIFIGSEVDSMHRFIMADTSLSDAEKAKAIQSMIYFMGEISDYLSFQKPEYDLPDAIVSFKRLLRVLLYHEPFVDILGPLGPRRSKLLSNAFWQYDECTLLEDFATYKRLVSSPGDIFQFLEKYPGFRFADSLIIAAAAHDPVKLASYLIQNKPGSQEIRNNKNIYLQQIVSLSEDRLATELLPFIVPLAEKKITTEEILEKRTEVNSYFQLLVNTLKEELAGSSDPSFIFHTVLRNGIKEKSLSFYVNQINELHGSSENIRFAAIKNLRIEDLYYIITSSEDQLYTSSYLGLYRRLMEYFRFQPADSIFRIVQNDNFRVFMRMAANYNTLPDFLSCMPQEKAAELLTRFISGIESDKDSGLEKAMDVADCYSSLSDVAGISELIQNELQSNLERCQSGQLYFGVRLYSILLQVFDLLKQKDSVNRLWTYLGNHEKLEREALQNKNGEIIELVLFYGDEDGISSFSNFLNLFKDAGKWEIVKNDFWVTIRSLSDQPIVIYANLPLNYNEGMDLQAQDSLSAFLRQQFLKPVILVHRGHSYHLSRTLVRLQPSVKLAILGSCGGYNSIISVANISPDAQIIVSKKTGSKFINDPIIDVINESLQNKKDLIWTEVWEKLTIRFSKNGFLLNLFNEYIPPRKNISLFVLKLFNFYR
jgi:hypothetical protein